MFCRNCGIETEETAKYCTKCGKATDTDIREPDEIGFGSVKERKEPFQRWSWGAFGLGWIYFAGMRYRYYGWLLALAIVVNCLMKSKDLATSALGIIVWLVMVIVFGATGRQVAWKSRLWKNEQDFVKTQKYWDIWGIIIFIVLQTVFYFVPLG